MQHLGATCFAMVLQHPVPMLVPHAKNGRNVLFISPAATHPLTTAESREPSQNAERYWWTPWGHRHW
eukprot:8450866-Pyramimonas_sp.AAC.1